MKKRDLKSKDDYLITKYNVKDAMNKEDESFLRIKFKEDLDIIQDLEALGWEYEKSFYSKGILSPLYEGKLATSENSTCIVKMICKDR